MKITIEIVGSIVRVEVDDEEIYERPSLNDKACSKAVPQDGPSAAGTGSELLAGREGRHEGEAVSADLPTNSPETATTGAVTGWVDPLSTQTGNSDLQDANLAETNGGTRVAAGETASKSKPSMSAAQSALYLRPNCQRPGREDCAGQGRVHCHFCNLIAAALEVA
jgi:hypothetical protein